MILIRFVLVRSISPSSKRLAKRAKRFELGLKRLAIQAKRFELDLKRLVGLGS